MLGPIFTILNSKVPTFTQPPPYGQARCELPACNPHERRPHAMTIVEHEVEVAHAAGMAGFCAKVASLVSVLCMLYPWDFHSSLEIPATPHIYSTLVH
jgi:hypothetical protein